jgi:hypothetical protein
MLAITPQMKILVALAPVDFRKGIDGLVQLCKATLELDPFSGAVFAFRNRRATAVKVLVYDGQGFWLCQKKLETEDTQILGFPEVHRAAYNRHLGPAENGRMVRISRKSGPRRCLMPRQGSLPVPPRAQWQKESFDSTNSGHS